MIYTIENDYYKADICSKGAELYSLYARKQEFNCLWHGDPAIWAGRAPFLFPIVGRLRDDRYTLDKKEYTMTIHGFAQNLEFELQEHTKDRLRLCLKSCDATRKIYPFDFSVISCFRLSDNSLTVTRIVENCSPRCMPFSLGEHFGFRSPFFPDEKLKDYSLTFEKEETAPRYPLTEKHLLGEPESFLMNTSKIPIKEDLFDQGALIFMGLQSKKVTLGKDEGRAALSLHYDDYSTIAFWCKSGTGVPYICIEPWNGYDTPESAGDDIYQKPGIIMLEPGQSRSFSCQIGISKS